ncbi:MAG TPA: hypothetical protein VIY48_09770, partial [Candidatus Paceibacterota bacterium]
MAIFTPPLFKFQFSPTTNPFDTPVWVDITPYVIDFQSKYGRQFELNRMETGEATFTLDNEDRRFDPTNTAGPYSPNLLPMKKFQAYAPNVIPVDSTSTLTITTQAAGTGSAGYTITDTPATYNAGLYTAARVQSPSAGMNATQGWVAFRMKPGFASSAMGGTFFPTWFNWHNPSESGPSNYQQIRIAGNVGAIQAIRWSGATTPAALNYALTFAAGDTLTVVMAWTSTTLSMSINGAAFQTQSNTNVPTGLSSLFDIGTENGVSGVRASDSTFLWFACGTGTLTNADAAAIAAIPDALTIWSATNSEPVGDATMMCWPSNASMIEVWPAASSTYRVPSTAYIFTGYIDQWPMKWEGPGISVVDCRAVDGLEPLAQADIVSTNSTLTTNFGANADLTFTSRGIGSGNNLITIAYNNNGTNPPTVTLSGAVAITVNILAGTTTATAIMNAVNNDPNASLLVSAALAAGSTGAGTPPAMTATNLGGGLFASELSGTRITNILNMIGWPVSDRAIDAGSATVAAQTFRAADHQKAKLHIADVENSEGTGYVFVNGQGFVVFH